MRIHSGIVVVCLTAFSGGYLAQGQNREKPAENAKKSAAGQSTAPAAKADAGKKPAEDPEEKQIRAGAEAFTKLYNAHDAKGLAARFSPRAEMIDEDDNVGAPVISADGNPLSWRNQ